MDGRGPASLKTLEQAQRLASEVIQKLPDRSDLRLVLGQVCLDRADALLLSPDAKAAGPVLDEGLRAVEAALAKAPGSPRALAVEGALLARQGRIETDDARKKAARARAKESLSKAFAQNPLLERRYGAADGN